MNSKQTIEFMEGAQSGGIGSMLEHPIGNDLALLMKDWDLEMNQEGAVVASLLVTLASMKAHNQVLQSGNPKSLILKLSESSESSTGISLSESSPSDPDFPSESSWFGLVLTALPKAKSWIYELAACQQVSRLNQANVKNYFASQDGIQVQGKSILPIVNVASAAFPRITEDESLRELLSDASFLRYHTTATSTPGLIARVFENLGSVSKSVFPEGTEKAVDNALEMYWDSGATSLISTRAIGISHAFLSATGALPENWYQGQKAKDTIMPTLYSAWVAFFRKFAAISIDLESINESSELSELMKQASRIFSGDAGAIVPRPTDKGKSPMSSK